MSTDNVNHYEDTKTTTKHLKHWKNKNITCRTARSIPLATKPLCRFQSHVIWTSDQKATRCFQILPEGQQGHGQYDLTVLWQERLSSYQMTFLQGRDLQQALPAGPDGMVGYDWGEAILHITWPHGKIHFSHWSNIVELLLGNWLTCMTGCTILRSHDCDIYGVFASFQYFCQYEAKKCSFRRMGSLLRPYDLRNSHMI